MNPEQQRVAIAEACGWSARKDKDGFWRAVDASGDMRYALWMSERNVWSAGIPDFLNDLNAMHEAEKGLTGKQRPLYQVWLMKIQKADYYAGCWFAIHATSSQRAEAFLRTIDKWEESK